MKSQKLSQPQQKQQTIKSKTLERLQQVRNWLRKKIAREALKKQREEEEKEKDSSSWLPNTSFTTILSVVEIGLTIFNLYLRTRQKQSPSTENEIPEVVNKTQTQSQTKRKSFGME